jgi:hypothetical protein
MKRLSVILAALAVVAAGCSKNDTPTAAADDTHPSFKATLLPANEVAPNIVTGPEAAASGVATIDFALVKDSTGAITSGTVNFRVDVTGFPPTTAITLSHIHTGAAGVSGGVLVNANVNQGEITLVNGAASYSRLNIAMTAAQAQQIVNNPPGYYFNVHTKDFPQGVMRGQLVKQ